MDVNRVVCMCVCVVGRAAVGWQHADTPHTGYTITTKTIVKLNGGIFQRGIFRTVVCF